MAIAYEELMQIDGSLSRNLEAARRSAHRLRGRQVYPDTISYWQSLLSDARTAVSDLPATEARKLARLMVLTEVELKDRDILH